MIKTYSKKRDGNIKLSESFRVREFACKDGTDTVIIDTELVEKLQRIRNWAGASVNINSGYRTPAHNKKISGSTNSKHCLGKAADILVSGKSINEVSQFAEAVGFRGIERNEDSRYVHVDTREDKYYWRRKNYKDITVSTFGGKCPYAEPEKILRRGSRESDVKWLQFWLKLWGYNIAMDGSFGAKTEEAVRDVQRKRGLTVDGIVGEKTRDALRGY